MPPVKKPVRKRRKTFLRAWRDHRDLTLEKVAGQIGIDPTNLGRIEKGSSPYSQDTLELLADVYGCKPSDLIDVDPSKTDSVQDIVNLLGRSSPDMRMRAAAVINALIKPN